MERDIVTPVPMRPAISWTIAVCVAVAAAPWLSGGQEPVAQLISGFSLLLGIVLAAGQPGVRQLKWGPLAVSYVALVGFALLSLVWSVNRYSTVTWVTNLVLAGAVFRLAYLLAGEIQGRVKLMILYLVSAVALAIYGLFLYVSGGYDRLTSTFYWPNPAAAYLIPALFLVFDRLRRSGNWRWGSLIVLFGASFVLTDSRAATAVGVVSLIIYCLCVKLNKRFWIILVFSVVASIGAAYGITAIRHLLQPKAVITVPGSRLEPASAGNLQSGADRLQYLESVVKIWESHPVGGSGAGTFADIHPQYQGRVISASRSAHNVYAQTLAELGLVGALLVVWLIVCLVVGVIRGLWRYPLGLAATLGVGAMWLHFGLDIDAQYPALVLVAAGITGAAYYQRPQTRPLGWRWPLVMVVAVVPLVMLYLSDVWTVRAAAAQTDGRYHDAVIDLVKAHSFGIYNPDILTAEAINRFTLGKIGNTSEFAQALMLARRAEHQDPADAQHYQLEGLLLQQQGHRTAAETAFRQALKADPYNHPEYSYNLALAQVQDNDPVAGLATANAMLGQYPPMVVANRSADPQLRGHLAQLAVLVGSIHFQAGDLTAAKQASKQALEFDPTDIRAEALASVLKQLDVRP